LSTDYQIAETDTFSKKIAKHEFKKIYAKIKSYVYPQLRKNPFFGPNIKKLKGELSGIFRYRVSDYRLFYTIRSEKIIIFILDIDHRKDLYKK
jgi:mRNA interferase RelE/StbE